MSGESLLYAGFASLCAAFVLCFIINVKSCNDIKSLELLNIIHIISLKTGFVLLSLAFSLMIYFFISDNFSVYYVWLYSSHDMPAVYKIAAVWAGQQGTFMFWTWLGSICVLWLHGKKTQYAQHTLLLSEFVVVFLFLLTLISEPFKLMSQFQHLAGTAAADGAGIDPQLLSQWMMIHPPITFIAYAAMTVPFASGVSHFLWNEDMEIFAHRWAQLSWLFFSLGVGLVGGIWTYEAGWGIWTWDASEAGSLIPWLLLTASLHQKKHQSFKAFLFAAAFISILFAAFIIRSGFWGSVHEFTETSINSVFGAAIVIAVLGTLYIIFMNRKKIRIERSVDTVTFAVMILLAAIVFIGLSIPLLTKIWGDEASVGAEFYNQTASPFVLLLFILLGVCMSGKKRQLLCIIAIHIGALLLVFGGVYATSVSSEYYMEFAVDDIGKTQPAGNYDIKLLKFHVDQNQRGNWVQRVTLEVSENGHILGEKTADFIRDRTGNYANRGILRMPFEDIFITFPGLEPVKDSQPVIPVHVKTYPLLNVFWLGDILLSLGIVLLMWRKNRSFF